MEFTLVLMIRIISLLIAGLGSWLDGLKTNCLKAVVWKVS